jgi:trehalose-phosphatase
MPSPEILPLRLTQPRWPAPTEKPRPLPRGLLPQLLARGRLLLCLDYDGTLSEITPNLAEAVPLKRARIAIESLAASPDRILVAVVSGRDIGTVRKLLGLARGIMFAGIHGLELAGADGVALMAEGVEESLGDLQMVRDFLAREVPAGRGFVVEDKRLALALHYRCAAPAEARPILARVEEFVARETPRLKLLKGKMVYEMLPRAAGGKGRAVHWFVEQVGEPRPQVAYFGDDTTDEDAFSALRSDTSALTVLVGPERPSFARYRVNDPSAVADILAELALALSSRGGGRRP